MRPFAVAVAAVLLASLVACSGGPGGALQLGWRFADGRDCANAGTSRVELRRAAPVAGDAPEATFPCALGLAPATVTTAMLPGSGTLYLDARSPAGGDLYRGTLALDGAPLAPTTATVTLYAAAAN